MLFDRDLLFEASNAQLAIIAVSRCGSFLLVSRGFIDLPFKCFAFLCGLVGLDDLLIVVGCLADYTGSPVIDRNVMLVHQHKIERFILGYVQGSQGVR